MSRPRLVERRNAGLLQLNLSAGSRGIYAEAVGTESEALDRPGLAVCLHRLSAAMLSAAMLRVVVDASSLVSYVLTQGQLMRRVVAQWRAGTPSTSSGRRFTLLSSPATRAELAAVLARPAIRQLATAPLDELARGLERFSEHVPGVLHLAGACRDPKACGEPGRTNDKFLACAVEGGAHYLVSSDHDLLDMRYYQNVAIVNPGQFLLALELHPMEARALAQRFGRDVLADVQATVPLEPGTAAGVAEALTMMLSD